MTNDERSADGRATDREPRSDGHERTGAGRAGPRERLVSAGLVPSSWSNGPGDLYAVHRHEYDKVIVVERGSIVFGLPKHAEAVALARGDRLDLPAGTDHDATVGPDGVRCLEAHCPGGTIPGPPSVFRDGEWG